MKFGTFQCLKNLTPCFRSNLPRSAQGEPGGHSWRFSSNQVKCEGSRLQRCSVMVISCSAGGLSQRSQDCGTERCWGSNQTKTTTNKTCTLTPATSLQPNISFLYKTISLWGKNPTKPQPTSLRVSLTSCL